jgi:hypothetical protein
MAGRGTDPLDGLLQRVAGQVRWRRAESYALRGGFWGAVAALVALVLRGLLGPWAPWLAGAAVLAGLGAGAAWGLLRRVSAVDAARLADRAFGLEDRVATAWEYRQEAERSALVHALLADTLARVSQVRWRPVVGRVWPREVRWLPVPVALALAVTLAPPLPLPTGGRLHAPSPEESEAPRERASGDLAQQDRRTPPRDAIKRAPLRERDWTPRGAAGGPSAAGDLSAVFKDTSLAAQRPDFSSFLKKGDERLKLLEQVDRLPDLQADYTASPYKVVFRKARTLLGGLRPDQISPEKLRELLQEMERLGRKGGGGGLGSEVAEGMEALEYGEHDRALQAMEKALNKLRAMEEAQRAGRSLRGSRESPGRGREPGLGGPGADEGDFGEGAGLLPGKGRSPASKGEATARLRATPYDVGVEGETRPGRKEAYDTNLTGRAARMPSRLAYFGLIGQYRRAMEDALAREQVPRDYHDQIRDYFQSLDER